MKTCEKVVATLLMLLIVILFPSAYAQQSSNPAVEKTLTALSVEEKLALLVGAEEILKDTIETQKAQINVPGAWAYTHAKSKPKITSVVFADVRGGLLFKPRTDDKANGVTVTLFPVPSVLAASWNKNLLWEVGAAIAKEASAAGVDVVTSPALNVVRNVIYQLLHSEPLKQRSWKRVVSRMGITVIGLLDCSAFRPVFKDDVRHGEKVTELRVLKFFAQISGAPVPAVSHFSCHEVVDVKALGELLVADGGKQQYGFHLQRRKLLQGGFTFPSDYCQACTVRNGGQDQVRIQREGAYLLQMF